MNRKIVLLAFVSVLLLSTVFGTIWLSGLITSATPTTWTVDDDRVQRPDADFITIQEAINNAKDGDIIEVYRGYYYESITIDKSISLIGVDGSHVTIIDAGFTKEFQVVTIKSSNVRVENFSIQHTFHEMNQTVLGAGIRLQSRKATGLLYGIVIHKNVISNVFIGIDSGFYVYVDLHDSWITENNIEKIWFEGIHLSGGTNFFVRGNIIDDVGYSAISMEGANIAEISQNNIRDSRNGLELEKGNSNNITGNTFTEIRNWGVVVGGSYNNVADNNVTSPNGILVNGNSSKIYHNTVKGGRGFGFSVGGAYNDIYSNIIIDGWEYGIWSWKLSNNFANNTIQNANVGMYNVDYSSGNQIENCSIGIHIPSTKGNVTIFNNFFHNCEQGVRVEGNFSNIDSNFFHNCEQGVRVEGNFCNISSNTFVNNYVTNGIGLYGCYNNTITRNLFLHSNYSICLFSASFNNITENTISSSVRFVDSYNSQYNLLCHNDVFNVTSPLPCCEEASANEYMNNYWDDYSGIDKDGDGYGDPYLVAAIRTYDNSPLDVPYGSFPILWKDEEYDCRIVGNMTVSRFGLDENRTISFNITGHGYVNLTIPRTMIDGSFQVFVDNTPAPCLLSWDADTPTHIFIYFEHATSIPLNVRIEALSKFQGDLNGDGKVNILDISIIVINFGEEL